MKPADKRNEKLFKAIVVMGAAMATPACDDDKCLRCVPPDDAPVDIAANTDAGTDASPADAPVDVVLIL